MKHILTKMFDYQSLNRTEAAEVLTNIASGGYNSEQIASFMTVYLMRHITMEEILGFREALLEMALQVDLSEFNPIDIVGTGGDGKNTFNISTLSCLVLAGAGFKVAKHGNYGATSVSGASNVLEYFGAKFTTDISTIKTAMNKAGFAFLHAPLFNPAMKTVAPIRKALAVRTFFNVMGPLISPVKPNYQVLGVYSLTMLRLYNYICQHLGMHYTLLHSLDGYDEVSLTADTKIISNTREEVLSPGTMGFPVFRQEELSGGNTIDDAAKIFMNVLENKATEPQKAVVLANSAFAIQTLRPELSFADAKNLADESLVSGKAKQAFGKFLEVYQ